MFPASITGAHVRRGLPLGRAARPRIPLQRPRGQPAQPRRLPRRLLPLRPPHSLRQGRRVAWCSASVTSFQDSDHDEWLNNVTVNSNQPHTEAHASGGGYSWSYGTDGNGHAVIYLNGPSPGTLITVTGAVRPAPQATDTRTAGRRGETAGYAAFGMTSADRNTAVAGRWCRAGGGGPGVPGRRVLK